MVRVCKGERMKKKRVTLRLSDDGLAALDRLCNFRGAVLLYGLLISLLLLGCGLQTTLGYRSTLLLRSTKKKKEARRGTISIDLEQEAFDKISLLKRMLYKIDKTGKFGKMSNTMAIEKLLKLADEYKHEKNDLEKGVFEDYKIVQAGLEFGERLGCDLYDNQECSKHSKNN